MAHRHEKFLAFPPGMNATKVCYSVCLSKCSIVCVPSLPPISYFDHPPPPPPPPVLPPPLIEKQSNHHISLLVIIIVAILASAFLLVSYYAIIVKYFYNRNTPTTPTAPATNTHEDHDQTQNPLDLIWYVRTVGLEESVINSISVCKYKRGEGLIEGTECSVCLNGFHEDEFLRLLPKCSHAFHLPCIDTWLKSHVNCPLCRANVVSNPVSSPSTDPSSISADYAGESRVGNSQSHIELGSNRSNGVLGNQSFVHDDASELGDLSSPRVICGFRAQSDMMDNHRSRDCAIEMMDDEIQPVRRSVSMDSSAAAMIVMSLANLSSVDSEGSSTAIGAHSTESEKSNLGESSGLKRILPKHGSHQSIFKTMGNCSKGAFLQRAPVLMKRSFSGGGKFLLTRYGRSRNSILPL